MRNTNFEMAFDIYYQWLKSLVYSEESGNHESLLACLNSMPYTYVVELDSNREGDGLYMRNIFYDEHEECEGMLTHDCTLLEMLVGFANRMAEDVFADLGKSTSDWFWEFMDNLGADYFSDDILKTSSGRDDLRALLQNFLHRRYKDSKSGNIFVFEREPIDLKSIELWYQMHFYIEEKYGF